MGNGVQADPADKLTPLEAVDKLDAYARAALQALPVAVGPG